MPEFERAQVEVVLRMMLAKSRLSPTASDFAQLADLVNEQNPDRQRPVSDHYFSDMHRMLAKAPPGKGSGHTMSQQHMDMCLRFLGYANHAEFNEQWNRIGSYFDGAPVGLSNKLVVLCQENDELYVASLLQQAYYPGQERQIIRETYRDVSDTLLQGLHRHSAQGVCVIWCLPQSEWTNAQASALQATVLEAEKQTGIIPLWPELDGALQHASAMRVRHMLPVHSEMSLALQFVQMKMAQDDRQTLDSAPGIPHQLQVSDSGTVILGNMTVEATYFSQKDMHITVHEYKKG